MRPRQYIVLGTVSVLVLLTMTFSGAAPEPAARPALTATRDYTAVEIKGELVGYTDDSAMVNQVLEKVAAGALKEALLWVDLKSLVTTRTASVQTPGRLLTQADMEREIEALLPHMEKGWAISVNGQDIIGVASQDTAQQVVEELQDDYKATVLKDAVRIDQVRFLESIQFHDKWLLPGNIRTKEQAKEILRYGTDKRIFYTVQRGDTIWTIANSNRIAVDDLVKANPDVNPDTMQIGQQINMTVKEPHVHLESTETQVYKESIPFPVEAIEDPDLWPWQTRVLQPGVLGTRQLTVKIDRQNGQEIKREVVDNQVLTTPKKQVVARGTRQAPTLGTGSFYWPVQGEISEYFGDVGWRWHPGVDIAAKSGTGIRAADSGTIVFAAYNGNYGYAVEIDHGEGKIVTLYGHLSAFNVTVGQEVQKGDVIGFVGNTGWSTGPHLHFEVRLDGRETNPLRFYQ